MSADDRKVTRKGRMCSVMSLIVILYIWGDAELTGEATAHYVALTINNPDAILFAGIAIWAFSVLVYGIAVLNDRLGAVVGDIRERFWTSKRWKSAWTESIETAVQKKKEKTDITRARDDAALKGKSGRSYDIEIHGGSRRDRARSRVLFPKKTLEFHVTKGEHSTRIQAERPSIRKLFIPICASFFDATLSRPSILEDIPPALLAFATLVLLFSNVTC